MRSSRKFLDEAYRKLCPITQEEKKPTKRTKRSNSKTCR